MARKKHKPITMAALFRAAECLKTLAHPHRLRMVDLLLHDEYTVGDLAEACEIQSHMASEHLRMMKDRGLLNSRRDGRRTYYRVEDEGLASIMQCIQKRYGR
ncbi:MAG: helix-turn-helix transcriptional regulator [Planctomycetes bacterium]|nr:helix-turn-helix transcriptional regulator [Planctomycetota bacterium]